MDPTEPLAGAMVQPSLFGGAASDAIADGSASAATRDPTAALAALHGACGACRRCGLALGRQQVVVSRGNPAASLMVIGEGPGAQEDASGSPFVGRAGQLLDQMFASVAIDTRQDAYVCNVVKCRPPDNRKPTPEEMAACLPWLLQQIELVQPKVLVLAGATAMEGVLGLKGGITKLRGQWRQWRGLWCLPIFHPSYLLRNPSRERGTPKWLTWQDLQDVRRRLHQLEAGSAQLDAGGASAGAAPATTPAAGRAMDASAD
ncbi:uracil-DNA glycosylase [Synechococcus sp. ATX 2A4]|uniref:uracil-DNA glycosylase n=1 Tax=Synechococcus sp. ATX 2A4 TaxID=2823727 RepID=UPI0020CE997A|nr:uracil-DNA glycosylase [Synechococcus sp. ATX 2A4]